MKKFIVLFILALAVSAWATFPGSPIGGGSSGGTTNADDLASGTVDAARGGTNTDTSGSTGTPYVTAGTWSVDNAATMRTNLGLGTIATQPSDNVAITGGTITGVTMAAKQDADADLTTLAAPTAWRVFYSNGTSAITELALGADGTYLKSNGASAAPTFATPSGAGTVNGPATATEDNVVTWGADNTAIKDGGVALSALARLAGPTFTGTVTVPTPFTLGATSVTSTGTQLNYLASATGTTGTTSTNLVFSTSPTLVTPTLGAATATTLDTGQGANELYDMDQNVQTTDNVTFNTVTATEFISNAANGTHKGNVANSGAASNLTTAGDFAYNLATGAMTIYDNVVGDNVILSAAIKTFSFGIDNVVDGDDILLWKLVRAATVTQVDCYASTDNVVGVLSKCASDNVTSCTAVDSTDWTVTNAVTGFSVNSGFENASIAAGAWLKWVTTSEGTSNSNKLSCTVRYRE